MTELTGAADRRGAPVSESGEATAMIATSVLVVGGGPVGLTTALELAHHGVPSVVVEPRVVVDHRRPRAKTTSARSMELFRRTGVADEIRRRAALPVEWSRSRSGSARGSAGRRSRG